MYLLTFSGQTWLPVNYQSKARHLPISLSGNKKKYLHIKEVVRDQYSVLKMNVVIY